MDRRVRPERRRFPRGGRRGQDHAGLAIVLVVDDHADSRELTATVLQEIGIAVAEAATGEAAMQRARALPQPHLILIDLGLPDCHGTDVVRAMKNDAATAAIPMIALSASVMTADKENAAAAGCIGFVEKPVMPDEIVRIVRQVLENQPQ